MADGEVAHSEHAHPIADLVKDTQGKTDLSDAELIKIRKDKAVAWLKKHYQYVSYVILAAIVWLAVRIRTRNLGGLRDVTTGTWTLGPDLDPFLFLRWAKYIVANGTLFAVDMMRYVPRGFPTDQELLLHPYLIAWFHHFASLFGSASVTHSAVLYPVFFFALTVIAFFLFTRKIFVDVLGPVQANIIALGSSLLLSVLPSLLPRTIAGIPEKESAAFFFLFITFYFILSAWKARNKRNGYIFSLLAAVATASMALVWGGYGYIFLVMSISLLLAFLFGMMDKHKTYLTITWIVPSFIIMNMFSSRFIITNLFASITTGLTAFIIVTMTAHWFMYKIPALNKLQHNRKLKHIPKPVFSLIVVSVLGAVLASTIFGPTFLLERLGDISNNLIRPATSRLIQTVAENRQPYFGEWSGSFGPVTQNGLPVLFWLFMAGSVWLFWNTIFMLSKRERYVLTGSFTYFLIAIVFSRYAQDHALNGENGISLLFYFSGVVFLLGSAGYYYYQYHKKGKAGVFANINYGPLMLLSFFVLGIVSARGAVRLIMMLVPPISIIVAYFATTLSFRAFAYRKRDSLTKFVAIAFAAIIVLTAVFSAYQLYRGVNSTAHAYVPSQYTQQWQYAMGWVRENTPQDAVFGHWWDYGYWVQSIGERATILDGGNALSYWNHLMGRYGLTNPDERSAIEFLYAHETTHFLIDSTDIGKYTAFSSIGSDVSYDRRSWIPSFERRDDQTFEAKNRTVYLYQGGFTLDDDVMYTTPEGEQIFIPGIGKEETTNVGPVGGIGGIRVEIRDDTSFLQPVGIFVYQGRQYELPLRYAFVEGQLTDFGTGVEAGVYMMPRVLSPDGQSVEIQQNGALLYLSARTVQSQLARLYLYGQETEAFTIAHVEDDFLVKQLKSNGAPVGSIVYARIPGFSGFRGPITIWEITYPEDIEHKSEFLETTYPTELSDI